MERRFAMRTTSRLFLAVALPFVFALSLGAQPAGARTWHILVNSSGDAPTIQAGIDSAAVGDTVLVHEGTYTGLGNKELSFGGKAIVLQSASGPGSTVIDCEGSGRGVYVGGEGYHPVVEGLTIRNGVESGGGAIWVEAECTIRN
jgi:hypothetical protein